ncbi:hypothetical protein FF38_07887 [Lucilia cuprina]|uniref:Uncharacterized protein n=1 Tax=Lucilia cuprina TaxID=7375 RepID=A0A0L0BXZ6_LUCCU|nr:hypothetical protein FF38_07887 [Lucilia cuprina]
MISIWYNSENRDWGLRHTSLRKPSFSNINNSSNINACPAPPPTPHCVCNTNTVTATTTLAGTGAATSAVGAITNTDLFNPTSTSGLSLTNSHINQQQINYFEFPPKASLLVHSPLSSLSAPSLATTTVVALAAATASNSSTGSCTNTSFSTGATGCVSANNSPKSIYHYQHHSHTHTHLQQHHHHRQQQKQQELQHQLHYISPPLQSPPPSVKLPSPSAPPTPTATQLTSHTITMGRREIKRSNTSGSTTKSYDSGSVYFKYSLHVLYESKKQE